MKCPKCRRAIAAIAENCRCGWKKGDVEAQPGLPQGQLLCEKCGDAVGTYVSRMCFPCWGKR